MSASIAPVSIALANLAWSTPDGRPLFTDLTFSFGAERTGLVGRNGVGKTTLLRLIVGELARQTGRVTVEGRIAILRQSVQVDPDETLADLFGVREALALLARAAAGEAAGDDLAQADWTLEARMAEALARLGLSAEPATPLSTLSGGQRTRAGLAALVFAAPDVLILDEPTNHLDLDSIEAVEAGLRAYDGALLVVSHDAAFLQATSVERRMVLGDVRRGENTAKS
jgi:ATPase subunit of ABC transporter with duplicated ATPase domains